jgi:hypothetical protein
MASNPYINKVVYESTTLIDITDTTAVAADVASGKYLYLASGQKVAGTLADGDSLEYGVSTQPLVGTARVGATEI